MARLKEQYVNEIAPALNKKFGYKSVMQIPSWIRSSSMLPPAKPKRTPRSSMRSLPTWA